MDGSDEHRRTPWLVAGPRYGVRSGSPGELPVELFDSQGTSR